MTKSRLLIAILLCSMIVVTAFTIKKQSPQKPRVAGTWDMNVQSSLGNGTPVMILKQENDTLITGTYSGQLGEAAIRGVVKGNEVKLEFTVSDNIIQYTGIVDGDNMKGRVKFGTMAEGTFTGKRRETGQQ